MLGADKIPICLKKKFSILFTKYQTVMKNAIVICLSLLMLANLNVSAGTTSVPPLPKKAVRKGVVLSVNELKKNLEFDFSRSVVRTVYYSRLDQLAQLLVEKNSPVALRGYADSIGSFKGNWHLSEKRANDVKNYLVKKGVNKDKIITTAFGSTKPIATNKTAQGRQKNRRVEINIVDTNDNS